VTAGLRGRVFVVGDPEELAELGARRVAAALHAAVAGRGRAALALAGGRTPEGLYRHLAAAYGEGRPDWGRIEIFQGDERCVDPSHPDSNHGRARHLLLDRLDAAPAAVHRIRVEQGAQRAAQLYAQLLEERLGRPPRLDLVLLGMGADGHTASLFPGAGTGEKGAWAASARAPCAPVERVTLTQATLDASRTVIVLVSGAAKAEALGRVARGEDLPAARLAPAALEWIVDAAAAADLEPGR
jgi:6-phosphogluconolactonase